jgi:hypothetical protein
MSLLYFGAGFVIGSILTVFLGVMFLKYKMRSQLGMMEEQMDLLMDSAENLQSGDFDMPDNMKQQVEDVEPKEK